MEGLIGIQPTIKKLTWEKPSAFSVYLEDGRIITVPTKFFPSAQKVKPADRGKYQILNGNMFTWLSCPEVFHVEQVLGKEEEYKYVPSIS